MRKSDPGRTLFLRCPLFSPLLFGILFGSLILIGCASTQRGWNASESLDSVPWDLGPSQALGHSLPGIWSSLTRAEINALAQLEKAKMRQPEALLRLFILASGNKREETDMARYQGQIQTFCDSMAAIVSAASSKKDKAEALFKGMYPHFIKSKGDNPIYGYDFDHSDLARLLDEKIYNCVSITMLYVLLGAHFQIDIQPVLMPGHAFAQMRLESGEMLEIETVTRKGFAIKHDKAFFQNQGSLLGAVYGRNLTYANYQKRRIVAAWELALENMRNQHTMPSVLGVQGYFRLRELQSVIRPSDPDYRRERLGLYYEAARQSKNDSNFSEVIRLCRVVNGFLDSVQVVAEHDSSLRVFYAHLRWHQAEAQMRQGDDDTSWFAAIDAAVHVMRHDIADSNHILSNSLVLLEKRWMKQMAKQRFERVEHEMNRYANLCRPSAACDENKEWLYQTWASSYWEAEAWASAIQKLELAYRHAKQYRKEIMENIGFAYCNWSNDFSEKEDYKGSLRILTMCLEKSPNPEPCRERISELKKSGVI